MFWTFLGQFVLTGIPRLILFPIAAYIVGKSDFGLFATAFSMILIVGTQPSNGLSVGMLRNIAHYSQMKQDELCYTALKMCHKFMVCFVFASIVVIVLFYITVSIETKTFFCLLFLTLSLYADNRFMLALTPLRYKRLFKTRTMWFAARALCFLLFGIFGCLLLGVPGLAFGIMAANYFMCWILSNSSCYSKVDYYNCDLAQLLASTWLQLSIAGILTVASPHLNRLVLRIYSDNESVADIFAAFGNCVRFCSSYNKFQWITLEYSFKIYKST